jgi:hypothetical protein
MTEDLHKKAMRIHRVVIICLVVYFLLGTCLYWIAPDWIGTGGDAEPGKRYQFTALGIIFAPVLVFWAFIGVSGELDE